ncbi:LPS export ABC transporter periplasmic protein LptC [Halomonas halocynthiae]|uniref:LPS export ABC transporter periplasmic protein LptC n=1 Tax=Halomonas halocynthiae TaxID=176290 RepID=UPI0004190868|nr:LPS export ABC transporter periplasmic protein LptC [Halomonas halocynthiae]
MAVRIPRPGFRTGLVLLIVALGAILTFLDPRDSTPPGPEFNDDDSTPDYIIEGAHLTRFDESGQPYQRIESPRVSHTPDDTTLLERPVIHLTDESQRRWVATALNGKILGQENMMALMGQARLYAPEERWQLDTHTLHYNGNTDHAWSDDYSVLRQPPQRMTGYRFDAWLNDNRTTLADNVRGYHPPATPETSGP